MSVEGAKALPRGAAPLGAEDCGDAETAFAGGALRATSTTGPGGGSAGFTVANSEGARSGTPGADSALLDAAEVVTR